MIGLALVTLVAVLASGIIATFRERGQRPLVTAGLRDHGAGQLLADSDRGRAMPPPKRPASRRSRTFVPAKRRSSATRSSRDGLDPRGGQHLQPRLGEGSDGRDRRRSATTARSSTRATRRTTTYASARGSSSCRRTGSRLAARRQGHLRAADGRLAVRPRHDLERDVGRASTTTRGTSTRSCRCTVARPTRTEPRSSDAARAVPEREGCRRGRSSSTRRSAASTRS